MDIKASFKTIFERTKAYLATLSFRTGVWVLVACAIFYVLSFAQMLLPISAAAKGVLWFILFGMAKSAQYTALAIIGADGIRRLVRRFRKEQ